MHEWLSKAMKHGKVNQPQLAAKLTQELGRHVDKTMVWKCLHEERRLLGDEVVAVSKVTGFPLPVNFRYENALSTVAFVPVRGTVASGNWLENAAQMTEESRGAVPCIPHRYAGIEQFSYRVSGNSMDSDRIHDGDFIICVPYWDVRARPTEGDTIVARRTQGKLTETSCRRIVKNGKGFELWPRPSEGPVYILPGGDKDVEIIGLVIGVYSPR